MARVIPWTMLEPFVTWLGQSMLGVWLGKSTGRIAGLLTVHLFGLTLLTGSLFVSCLHLMGLIDRDKPVGRMTRDVGWATTTGLVLMLASGFLIFTGGAVEYFATPWFRTKMVLLLLALSFHFVVYRRVTRIDGPTPGPVARRLTGALALLLWFSVAFAGRAIGFF